MEGRYLNKDGGEAGSGDEREGEAGAQASEGAELAPSAGARNEGGNNRAQKHGPAGCWSNRGRVENLADFFAEASRAEGLLEIGGVFTNRALELECIPRVSGHE